MSVVAGGRLVTLSIAGNVPAFGAPSWASVQALVSQKINNSGWLVVVSATYQTPSQLELLENFDFLGYPYTATLVVRLAENADGSDSNDIAALVADAFAEASTQSPNSVSVTAIGGASTGQPGATAPAGSTIGSWLESLAGGLQTTVLIIAVILIVLIVVLAPQAGSIARAVA